MAVVAAMSKGYDLDYIWKQGDCSPVKDAASYYIRASAAVCHRTAGGAEALRR